MQTSDISYFTLSLYGGRGDFANDLAKAVNSSFLYTVAQLTPIVEVPNILYVDAMRRMAVMTALHKHPELRRYIPITPDESENILRAGGKLNYPEVLGLVLNMRRVRNIKPYNGQEAMALYQSIKAHRKELGLSSGLEDILLVINPGLEKDSGMPYRVRPIVLPGLTEVQTHDALKLECKKYKFDNASDKGLPACQDIGKGERTFSIREEFQSGGLWALVRGPEGQVLSLNPKLAFDGRDRGSLTLAPYHPGLSYRMTMLLLTR